MMADTAIQAEMFGSTGVSVTRVGLGGEGVLRTTGKTEAASAVIRTAIAQGITYYDCARVYSDSELYYGSVWGEAPETRQRIFQASKSASRDKKGALRDLDDTLTRFNVDYLDLWQIHDIRTDSDLMAIADSGGALEAFEAAKASGKVRFIGVTGHHDPAILTRAVMEWPVDSVMMPVNPVEGVLGGFLTQTLAAAKSRGVAVIGMKILGAGHYIEPRLGVTPELLIRYAIAQGISVAIVGCSTSAEVEALAEAGRMPERLSDEEKARLIDMFKPHARRLAFYRGVI